MISAVVISLCHMQQWCMYIIYIRIYCTKTIIRYLVSTMLYAIICNNIRVYHLFISAMITRNKNTLAWPPRHHVHVDVIPQRERGHVATLQWLAHSFVATFGLEVVGISKEILDVLVIEVSSTSMDKTRLPTRAKNYEIQTYIKSAAFLLPPRKIREQLNNFIRC